MMKTIHNEPAAPALLDRRDERVHYDDSLAGSIRAFGDRIRSGDLGSLPVIVGLAIIWTVFQALNPVFLSSSNLVNMLFDCSTVGVISLGIVCILMVGEIDLSVGSVSGFASALVGVFWVNQGWPVVLAILAAMIVGALIGSLYAFLFNRFGMPSFVSTLSGLLAVLGLQLYILGATGSINLPYGSWLVSFGQIMVMPDPVAYLLVALAGIAFFFASYRTSARRRAAGLSAKSARGLLLRAVIITLALEAVAFYLNQSRGIPWMFGLFVGLTAAMNYTLTRTKWGRSMHAVGGNRKQRAAPASTSRGSTQAPSSCALCLRQPAAFSPPHGWRRQVSRPAPATSISTPSPRRSSAARACSAGEAVPIQPFSASSSFSPLPVG